MAQVPSAFWVDTISKIKDAPGMTLTSLLRSAAGLSPPPLVVAILYDLPNRDCHAHASNGELCCEYHVDGTCVYDTLDDRCQEGLVVYQHEYVDAFVQARACMHARTCG